MSDVSQPKPDTASASLSGSVDSMALTRKPKEETILTKINEQLIEQIEDYISIREAADTMFTSDKWLRALLKERQGLLREMEARDRENDLTCKMLEQVKAERDDYRNALTSISDGGSTGEDARDMRSEADSILSKYGGTP